MKDTKCTVCGTSYVTSKSDGKLYRPLCRCEVKEICWNCDARATHALLYSNGQFQRYACDEDGADLVKHVVPAGLPETEVAEAPAQAVTFRCRYCKSQIIFQSRKQPAAISCSRCGSWRSCVPDTGEMGSTNPSTARRSKKTRTARA